jgi:hypothetical protein
VTTCSLYISFLSSLRIQLPSWVSFGSLGYFLGQIVLQPLFLEHCVFCWSVDIFKFLFLENIHPFLMNILLVLFGSLHHRWLLLTCWNIFVFCIYCDSSNHFHLGLFPMYSCNFRRCVLHCMSYSIFSSICSLTMYLLFLYFKISFTQFVPMVIHPHCHLTGLYSLVLILLFQSFLLLFSIYKSLEEHSLLLAWQWFSVI